MKNNVSTRSDGNVLHIILPSLLKIMNQRIGPQASFNLTNLRRAIADQEGTSIDHASSFGGSQQRCVKIPRRLVSTDILAIIDKGKDC
jgi:hypothetical protein